MDKAEQALQDLRELLAEAEKQQQKVAKLFRFMVGLFGGNCIANDSLISEVVPLQEVEQGPQWDNLLIDIDYTPENLRVATIKALVFKYLKVLDLNKLSWEASKTARLASMDKIMHSHVKPDFDSLTNILGE
jgi:hypothetical protein